MEAKQTEEIILAAAEKLFLEQGFRDTTTAQIAKEAGCNSALVHYYFRTKEKLFARIFESKVDIYLQGFFVELEGIEDVDTLVRHMVHSHWQFILEHGALATFMAKELLTVSERTRSLIKRHLEIRTKAIQHVEILLRSRAEQGLHYALSAEALIRLVYSLTISYFAQLFIRTKALDQALDPHEVQALEQEIITITLASLHYRP